MNCEGLKIGDEVVVSKRTHQDNIVTITGETPKYWRIGKKLYCKKDGYERGGNTGRVVFSCFHITELIKQKKDG